MAACPRPRFLTAARQRPGSLHPMTALILAVICLPGLLLPRVSGADTRLGILPPGETIVIRLSGKAPALVQEQRMISLSEGINQVAFSWSGIHLEKDAILLTPLAESREIQVLSSSFPPDGTRLVWEIYSSKDRVIPVIISFLPAGLDYQISYTAVVDAQETFLDLNAHLVLRNFSGLSYPNAAVWLKPDTVFHTDLNHLETRQIHFQTKKNMAVTKIHQWDGPAIPAPGPKTAGQTSGIPTAYEFANTRVQDQDTADLFPGKVRLFLEDTRGRTLFFGDDRMPFVPKGDKTRLKTGDSRDILVSKKRMDTSNTRVRRNENGEVQVFDRKTTDRLVLENTRTSPAVVHVTHRITGQWEPVDMGHAYTLKDFQTLVFEVHVDAGEKKTIDLTYLEKNIFAGNFKPYNTPVQ
jgi:hypothetical protein